MEFYFNCTLYGITAYTRQYAPQPQPLLNHFQLSRACVAESRRGERNVPRSLSLTAFNYYYFG